MSFSQLPDEIISSILSLLSIKRLIAVQRVSKQLHSLARDSKIWKEICFDESRFEQARRRKELLFAYDERYTQIRQAAERIPGAFPTETTDATINTNNGSQLTSDQKRRRALVNWDPVYSGEEPDFYQEYRHRHGQICVDWFETPSFNNSAAVPEAVGVGTITNSDGLVQQVLSPLDDGSLGIWEASAFKPSHLQGRLIARSSPGFLAPVLATNERAASITNEAGATENVSIDSKQQRAYLAIHDSVCEVDVNTLQIVQRAHFPFPVTALSPAEPTVPLTVGTMHTMHLYDARLQQRDSMSSAQSIHSEQIGGANTSEHSILQEKHPLSILHHPLPSADHEIWVGGRFTSLLCYDRRSWPRVSQTIHSGAHLSCLSVLSHPFIPQSLDLVQNQDTNIGDRVAAKRGPGITLLAAGAYKGKGSLELYGLSRSSTKRNASDFSKQCRLNRQTASRTRLLSVATHGMRLVFSDGDGNMKWTERDGSTLVRYFNINDYIPKQHGSSGNGSRPFAEIRTVYHGRDSGIGTPSSASSEDGEVSETTALFAEGDNGDIVQRIILMQSQNNDLLIWTADGRLGVVGFGRGRGKGFGKREARDIGEEESRREREEHLHQMRMRKALERNADEMRYVQNLGMGGRWQRG